MQPAHNCAGKAQSAGGIPEAKWWAVAGRTLQERPHAVQATMDGHNAAPLLACPTDELGQSLARHHAKLSLTSFLIFFFAGMASNRCWNWLRKLTVTVYGLH